MTTQDATDLLSTKLGFVRQRLLAGADFIPMFFLITLDGVEHIVQPTDYPADVAEAKDGLAALVRQRAKDLKAVAIISLADAYYAQLDRTAPNLRELYRLIDTIGVRKAAALGICQLGEAIHATLETSAGSFTMKQPYLRNPDKPGELAFMEPEIHQITPQDRSRFLGLL